MSSLTVNILPPLVVEEYESGLTTHILPPAELSSSGSLIISTLQLVIPTRVDYQEHLSCPLEEIRRQFALYSINYWKKDYGNPDLRTLKGLSLVSVSFHEEMLLYYKNKYSLEITENYDNDEFVESSIENGLLGIIFNVDYSKIKR